VSLRLLALVLVPVVLAAALAVWQWLELADQRAAEDDDRAAVEAATEVTLAWASVDHRRADEYVETVKEGATGAFLKEFSASENALRALLKDNKSVQVPTIPEDGVGLVERSGDEARVLIAMDATVDNTSVKRPQPREYRLQVTVSKVEGEWLVSGMEFIDVQD
jgi:Mce-associated membrane protein